MGLLSDIRLPLPRVLRSCRLDNLSYPELEKAVLDSHIAEYRWLKRRGPGLTLYANDEPSNIRHLDFLDDRWIISIPATDLPVIWDTLENPPKLCELDLPMPYRFHYETFDAKVALDPHEGDIIIGLRK